jgi:hypothetical protein
VSTVFRENVMIGLTHNEDGTPRIRLPRQLKVGIGIPRGKALRVFIHPTEKVNPWYVVEGYYEGSDRSLKERSHRYPDRESAEVGYIALRDREPAVPECGYPRKLKFFTFSKPTVTDKGAEIYEPDFDAIESHGPTPTRIPILFIDANPLRFNYQLWAATELRCKGDGVNASRSVLIGSEKDPGWKEAKAAGERYFPIVEGCHERGCRFAASKECKPGLSMNFQTANHLLYGVAATFHTTGFESCSRTFSSFTTIKAAVERATGHDISGLGVFMAMRPYVTHPEGKKAATQYAIHVELPLKAQRSIVAQLRAMFEDDVEPKQIAAPVATISGAAEAPILEAEEDVDGEIDDTAIGSAAMAAEFYGATPDVEDQTAEAKPAAATATQDKQKALGEKLKKVRETPTAPVAAAPAQPTVGWPDKAAMDVVMLAEKTRIGVEAFSKVFSEAGTSPSNLKPDSEKAETIYKALQACPALVSEIKDDDPF